MRLFEISEAGSQGKTTQPLDLVDLRVENKPTLAELL